MEIQKKDWLADLAARFRLTRMDRLFLSRYAVPVVSVDQARAKCRVKAYTVNLDTTAGSWVSVGFVPKTEEWVLLGGRKPATTGNSMVMIRGLGDSSIGHLSTSQAAAELWDGFGVRMPPGSELGAYATDDIGDGARIFDFFVEVTEVQ